MLINNTDVFGTATLAIVSLLLSGVFAFPIINLLYKLKILRHFDVDFSALIESRKQKIGTPIMGGLIFILPVLIINAILNWNNLTAVPLLIFASAALLGALDDILNIFGRARKIRSIKRTLKLITVHKSILVRLKLLLVFPWNLYSRAVHVFESNPGKGLFGHEKLLIQIILGALLGYWMYSNLPIAGNLWIPFGLTIDLGILIIPFAIIAMIGMINAVNISDGLDGLSAGMLTPAFAGLLAIAVIEGNEPIAILCASIVGALITYLYFNIPPARVQMGDTGSFAAGALLTAIAFALGKPLLLLIIGLPFIVEFMSTFLQSIFRRLLGRRLLLMAPLHHHLEMLGWGEEKVVMRFWLFALASAVFAVWIYFI